MAIKYAMMKQGRQMAKGGDVACAAHGSQNCEMCHGGEYAKGGEADEGAFQKSFVNDDYSRDLHEAIESDEGFDASNAKEIGDNHGRDPKGILEEIRRIRKTRKPEDKKKYAEGGFVEEEKESGYQSMPEEYEKIADEVNEDQDFKEEDIVDRIMRQLKQNDIKEGQEANDTPMLADYEKNEFDDLVKDDELEEHYTGANSGDEIGDAQEDEDRDDIVSRIMKSRRLKDRMPNPM